MSKEKIRWRSIGIPAKLFERLRNLIVLTGTPSVSEYVREAIAFKMRYDEERLESNEP